MIFTIFATCSVMASSTTGWLTCAGALLASDFSQVIAWSTYSILQQITEVKNSNIFNFGVGNKGRKWWLKKYKTFNVLYRKQRNESKMLKKKINLEKFEVCNR